MFFRDFICNMSQNLFKKIISDEEIPSLWKGCHWTGDYMHLANGLGYFYMN